jgi:uncharacterized protein YgbK (DUF1537 family)
LQKDGVRHAIVDAIEDMDLENIGAAAMPLPLITGGSGVAIGLPANFRISRQLQKRDGVEPLAKAGGHAAVLSGSCSAATNAQVKAFALKAPSLALDPLALASDSNAAITATLDWARPKLKDGPVLIYSTAAPDTVAAVQSALGRDQAGHLIEQAMAEIAKGLVEAGVRRLVVAGGETSGAAVSALGIEALDIGPQIAPGVPATLSYGNPRIALALKSGNFGGPDFFAEALGALA